MIRARTLRVPSFTHKSSLHFFVSVAAMAVFMACAIWALLHLHTAIVARYLPSLSDELSYYKNIQSFVATGTADVAIAYDLTYSKIGAYSSHGPFYTYLYAAIPYLFGFDYLPWMLVQNSIFGILAAGIAWRVGSMRDRGSGSIAALLVCSSFVFVSYLHIYMVELFHIFAAVALAGFIANQEERSRGCSIAGLFGIIGFAFVLSLFRASWIALYALAPLQARSWRGAAAVAAACLVPIYANLWIYVNFFASYENGFLDLLLKALARTDLIGSLGMLQQQIQRNLLLYWSHVPADAPAPFKNTYLYYKALYIISFALCAALAWRAKSRLLAGVFLVDVLVLASLFSLYDAFSWREHRSLAALSLLNLLVAIRHLHWSIVASMVAAQLYFLPAVLDYRKKFETTYRHQFRETHDKSTDLLRDLAKLQNLEAPQGRGRITIGVGPDVTPQDLSVFLLRMPVVSGSGSQIRYSLAVRRPLRLEGHDYLLVRGDCPPDVPQQKLRSFVICGPYNAGQR